MIPELSAMLNVPRHLEMLLRNDEVNEENPEVSLSRLTGRQASERRRNLAVQPSDIFLSIGVEGYS